MRHIRKKITALVLAIVTLFLVSVPVYAAREEEFISEVALVYEDSVEDAKKAIAGTDWKLFEQDLNPDADLLIDDGVYLIYKTSTNVEDAITDLRVMDMYGGYSSANYEKQLEASRNEYKKMVAELRIVASEFALAYTSGDAMAALANKQLNFYKDVKTEGGTETGMNMGDFFMNMPSDDQVIQVLFEGNSIAVSNLITLLAIGISGSYESSLADRIVEKYAIKNTLSDELYYDDAVALYNAFDPIRAKLKRYDNLLAEHDFNDEDLTEEEFTFLSEYASIFNALDSIMLDSDRSITLLEVIFTGNYTEKDLYPIAAALTEGQMALVRMGQLETIINFGAPSASPEELNAYLDDYIKEANEEYDGVFDKGINVYAGVDRSIFKGSFAMTSAADRQQALSGETWNIKDAAEESKNIIIASYAVAGLAALPAAFALGYGMVFGVTSLVYAISDSIAVGFFLNATLTNLSGYAMLAGIAAVGIALIAAGMSGIAIAYNYYNPKYTEIPNNLIDVRDTDLGDKYVKYTAAKVFEDGKLNDEKNADFNAYQAKEWNALYYTKDATAGNALLANFSVSNSSSAVARRYQGVSMFGETNAYNLNSHVYNGDAPGVYLTVRYSTTKKAAAEVPTAVGSVFATGALYTLTAIGGAGVGAGALTFVNSSINKKKKESETVEETPAVTE